MNEHCASFGCCTDHLFQFGGHVGNSRQHRSDIHSSANSSLSQLLHSLQAQIGAGRTRLQNASQIAVGSSDRDVDGKEIVFSDALQHLQVTEDQVRLGNQADLKPLI